jgi:hypothetical protein
MTKGKTISAHVPEITVEKIDQLAKLENRSRSQMAGASVELCGDLPQEAWTALFQLKASGTPEDWQSLQQDLTRVLLHYRYQLTQRQLASQVDPQWLESLETEDDILAAAVDLTRHD